jgi:aryl-phospho-beta-D-glucosidase BglC (GH1 family)
MGEHFDTFISDHDFSILKESGIDTLRIPVTYSMFLPKANRTDNFPKGEIRALDVYVSFSLPAHLRFIERALEYDLKIWLDLMANYNNHLGQMQKYGWEITPETAKYVVKQIAKKYDPRVSPYPPLSPIS